MNTKTSICNAALALIGARQITAFEEDTSTAESCRNIYDMTRKALLRKHPWSCAKKRAQLSPNNVHPSFGYSHAFPLPKDFVRLIDVGTVDFEVESRHVLANSDLINLIYIFDNDNEATWDDLLAEAMAYAMAAKLCKPITGSDAAGQTAEYKLTQTLRDARAVNGQERPAQTLQIEESPMLQGRH